MSLSHKIYGEKIPSNKNVRGVLDHSDSIEETLYCNRR